MSGYLQLAKKVIEEAPTRVSQEELEEGRLRKQEEASRRGLVVRWGEYPTWIALHDPLNGEWHELSASACLPSLIKEADRRRKKKRPPYEKDETNEKRSKCRDNE